MVNSKVVFFLQIRYICYVSLPYLSFFPLVILVLVVCQHQNTLSKQFLCQCKKFELSFFKPLNHIYRTMYIGPLLSVSEMV